MALPSRLYGQYLGVSGRNRHLFGQVTHAGTVFDERRYPRFHTKARGSALVLYLLTCCHGIGAFSYWLGLVGSRPIQSPVHVVLDWLVARTSRAVVCLSLGSRPFDSHPRGKKMASWKGLISWVLRHGSGVFDPFVVWETWVPGNASLYTSLRTPFSACSTTYPSYTLVMV